MRRSSLFRGLFPNLRHFVTLFPSPPLDGVFCLTNPRFSHSLAAHLTCEGVAVFQSL